MNKDLGRAPSGQALVSDEAPMGLHPSGFDPSRRFRLLGFATGHYWGKCAICGFQFEGDKRAIHCLACAAEAATRLIATGSENERRIADARLVIEGCFKQVPRRGECPHGRLYYEDCVACYDDALLAALDGNPQQETVAARQYQRAQGTEARRAETGTGSVHDGPV